MMSSTLQITTEPWETGAGTTITVKEFKYTDNIRYTALYFLFAYFWTSEFIVAMGQVCVCVYACVISTSINRSNLAGQSQLAVCVIYCVYLSRGVSTHSGVRKHESLAAW